MMTYSFRVLTLLVIVPSSLVPCPEQFEVEAYEVENYRGEIKYMQEA